MFYKLITQEDRTHRNHSGIPKRVPFDRIIKHLNDHTYC